MRIYIGCREYNVDVPIGSGAEGAVYVTEHYNAAKVYHSDANINTTERKQKVLALCNYYANDATRLGTEFYAFPEHPAYSDKEIKLEFICGFSMHFFPGCPTFGDIGYDLSTQQFKVWNSLKINDDKAIELIFNMFDVIEGLHKSRIILGDINPSNLLYNSSLNHPIVIDLDAAQVGTFPCIVYSEEYIDPLVQQQGKSLQANQGKNLQAGYRYSSENDVFSIACICFELFVGVNPFFLYAKPPGNIVQNKEKGISILRYIHEKVEDINGVKCLPNPYNESIKSRINTLRLKSPELFDFFVSVFVNGHRLNLMQTLSRDDPRHPAYIFYSGGRFDKILKTILIERENERINSSKSSSVPSVKPYVPDSGFLKSMQQIKKSNSDLEIIPSQSTKTALIQPPVIPDSGFSKILQSINKSNTVQSIHKTTLKNEKTDQENKISSHAGFEFVTNRTPASDNSSMTEPTDSYQLSVFLKNYSIDINDIMGSQ